MLQLRPEQFAQVDALRNRRIAQGIADAVKVAWPALAEHLGERCAAFIAAAVERGHQGGLRDSGELARYTCLCGLWGVGFETRPGFEWAADIRDDARRTPALKLHQLLAGARRALASEAAASVPGSAASAHPSATAFDATLALLAKTMDATTEARAIFLDATRSPPPRACDISAITLALRDAAPRSRYVQRDSGWQREAWPLIALAPIDFDSAPEAPPAFALMGSGAGCDAQARAALSLQTLAICDDRKHPEVLHVDAGRRTTWTGTNAARLVLSLDAPQVLPADPTAAPTGIGHVVPPRAHALSIASCGVRDAGAPFGAWTTALNVHDSTQWLCEVRHDASPPIELPANVLAVPDSPAKSGTNAPCRLEADGLARDAAAWDLQWRALQPQCAEGVEKMFNAWARGMADGSALLEGELSPLVGNAGLSWGWHRVDAERIAPRIVGQFDWAALAADLRFGGVITVDGARARLQLQVQMHIDWRSRIDTDASADAPPELAATLDSAKCEWHQPFTLSLDPIVGHEPAMLYAMPQPEAWRGALVGQCGLRPRPDEKGWQWFFTLRTEAVLAEFVCADALLGERRIQRELMPALTLVDWSAG